MNRIPTIAGAVALLALLFAGYLALSSRIARLEEAATTLRGEPVPTPAGALNEFSALGYDGASDLRLALSTRLAAPPAPSPFASAPPPAPPESESDEATGVATEVARSEPPPVAAPTPAEAAPERTASTVAPPAAVATAPILHGPEKPGWFAQFRDLVGLGDEPTPAEIEAGIREALNTGTDAALTRLGQPGGYANDPEVAIPLPQKLEAVRSVLKGVGMSVLMDDLRNRLNRAAELAAPDTREVLLRAIAELPLDDRSRLQARDDAATAYLRSRMAGRLTREIRPLMDQRLNEVGAHGLYQQALGIYSSLPFVPPIEGDLTTYVTSRGLDGIFLRVKIEEQQIRANPQRHTTLALQAAFGETRD